MDASGHMLQVRLMKKTKMAAHFTSIGDSFVFVGFAHRPAIPLHFFLYMAIRVPAGTEGDTVCRISGQPRKGKTASSPYRRRGVRCLTGAIARSLLPNRTGPPDGGGPVPAHLPYRQRR